MRMKVEIKRKCTFLNFKATPFLKRYYFGKLTNLFYESKLGMNLFSSF